MTENNNREVISGVLEYHKLYEYDNNESGFSITSYNYIFDQNNNKLEIKIIPEYFNSPKVAETVLSISSEKQREIIANKSTQLAEVKTTDSVKKESNRDLKKEYGEKLQNVSRAKCDVLKVNAASGGTYDKNAASLYGINYSYSQSNYNPNFVNFNNVSGFFGNYGSECANFASQVLLAGGLAKDYGNNDSYQKDWYFQWNNQAANNYSKSVTWAAVPENMKHMYYNENTSAWMPFMYGNNSVFNGTIDRGDPIYVDWNNDGIYDHVLMITGWDSPSPANGNNWKPYISAHSADRQNVAWETWIQIAKNSGKDTNIMQFKGLHHLSTIW